MFEGRSPNGERDGREERVMMYGAPGGCAFQWAGVPFLVIVGLGTG